LFRLVGLIDEYLNYRFDLNIYLYVDLLRRLVMN